MPQDTRYLYIGSWIAVILLYFIGRIYAVPPYFSTKHPLSMLAFLLMNVLFLLVLLSMKKGANEAIEEAMRIDPLSNLFNSAHFLEAAEAEIDRSQRNNYNITLIYFDIDYFHRYNENKGMKAGDKVIARMGEILAGMTRKYDLGFRFGNDEFALLLPQTDKVQSRFIAERISEAFNRSYEGLLSLSVGLAQFGEDDTVDLLLRKAENAMNEARRAGGGMIRTHINRGQI